MLLKHLSAVALAASLGSAQALATPAFTVNASYDPFLTNNTTILVINNSTTIETNVTLFSGSDSELLGTIAPGDSASYSFNEVSGPFIVSPGSAGVPDTTDYQVSATELGQTLTSDAFSPVTNLTGSYVDFLGACFQFSVGCSVDPTVNYPLSADVAVVSIPSAVPEPAPLASFGAGMAALAGLAAARRRHG
jgi:hypothetical protein